MRKINAEYGQDIVDMEVRLAILKANRLTRGSATTVKQVIVEKQVSKRVCETWKRSSENICYGSILVFRW